MQSDLTEIPAAATLPVQTKAKMMTNLLLHPTPGAVEIDGFKPKATSVTDNNQMEASLPFWEDADDSTSTGIWECTPGRFTTFRENSTETCFILEGRVTLHSENGEQHTFGAGEMFTLPMGWRGSWEVHETVRKIYFITKGTPSAA
ncbi:cupin domain-containing protein [Pseudomonas sp. R2.Fl]|nr:cupin domain-containing protein [Pseudomonas sp. R2.Fl]